MSTPCGSPCYAAPETILGKNYNPHLSDIWSCGIILFAMVAGFLPFENTNTKVLYEDISNGIYEVFLLLKDSYFRFRFMQRFFTKTYCYRSYKKTKF